MNRKGFTLVEMMMVLGIIAILSGIFMMTYSRIQQSSQRAKVQALVSDVSVALVELHRRNGGWPDKILSEASGNHRTTRDVARVFAKNKLLGIGHEKGNYDPTGIDRCGIVTPWAQAVLKKSAKAGDTTAVPTGKTVADHMLYFAVDADENGIVERSEGAPADVRATAVVWSAGADGVLGTYGSRADGGADDVYSWQLAQEKKK